MQLRRMKMCSANTDLESMSIKSHPKTVCRCLVRDVCLHPGDPCFHSGVVLLTNPYQ